MVYGIWTEAFAFIGFITAGFVCLSLLAVAIILLWRFVPRVHFGKPKTDIHLMTYCTQILPTKSGKEPTRSHKVIQNLRLKWWIGLSSGSSAKRFFGFIRWEIE